MIGSFLTRGLVMVFGYAYPAYECYKTVEKNKPEIEQLRFWCQYWILVALLTVCERIGDTFISWVPMYSEAKLAFYIYLWYPKTKGTSYVYDSFFKPYVSKHESEIDRNIMELRIRAGDIAVSYWQKAASYAQTRVFDILQYVASQSTPRPRPVQRQKIDRARQPPPTAQPQQEPSSPTSSSSSDQPHEGQQEEAPPQVPSSSASSNALKTPTTQPATETISVSTSTEAETMQIEAVSPSSSQNENPESPSLQETIMEETIRITRGRLRKNRSAPVGN